VAAAEHWLGATVRVMPPAQRMLQAARSLWNLRQFELARRTRGARALRDSLRRFLSPEWRPVRIGVVGLVLVQVLALNMWAWHQRNTIEAKRAQMQALVKSTFPNANPQDIERDAQAVMQRETQALRTLAGKPGDADLEPMLQAAASAWPNDRPPVDTLRFEPGRLTLSAPGWSDSQIAQFRGLLRSAGWAVEASEGRLTLSPVHPGSPS
jgi:general secretion pathway protein L